MQIVGVQLDSICHRLLEAGDVVLREPVLRRVVCGAILLGQFRIERLGHRQYESVDGEQLRVLVEVVVHPAREPGGDEGDLVLEQELRIGCARLEVLLPQRPAPGHCGKTLARVARRPGEDRDFVVDLDGKVVDRVDHEVLRTGAKLGIDIHPAARGLAARLGIHALLVRIEELEDDGNMVEERAELALLIHQVLLGRLLQSQVDARDRLCVIRLDRGAELIELLEDEVELLRVLHCALRGASRLAAAFDALLDPLIGGVDGGGVLEDRVDRVHTGSQVGRPGSLHTEMSDRCLGMR